MLTNIRYILLTALRDWLFGALMLGVIACTMMAHLIGSTALIENQEMTLAYTSATARGIIVTGLFIFACFHVRNAFETKEIDLFLSRPITRASLVLSYWLGFAVVALLLVLPTVGFLALQGLLDKKGFALWSLSLLVECWLAVAVALFASFAMRSSVTSILSSMGFYLLSRMMGFFVVMAATVSLFGIPALDAAIANTITVMAHILPRLDLFAKSEWLVYGVRNMAEYKLGLSQAAIYIPALILATIIDFKRKQF